MKYKQTQIALLLTLATMAPASFAADSVNHGSQSGKHSAIGASHFASGAVKMAAGSVAVPLLVVGSVGTVGSQAGESLMDFAVGEPLPIADEVIVAGPPPKVALADKTSEK